MLEFSVRVLATFRLTSLLVHEEGPFEMFGKIRDRAGIRYTKTGAKFAENQVGEMLLCSACTSLWVGAAMLILPRWVAHILAYSTGALLVERSLRVRNNYQAPPDTGGVAGTRPV